MLNYGLTKKRSRYTVTSDDDDADEGEEEEVVCLTMDRQRNVVDTW
jgi:hypothetical protein